MIDMESSDSNKLLIHFFVFIFTNSSTPESCAERIVDPATTAYRDSRACKWATRHKKMGVSKLLPLQSSAPSKKYYRGITWKKKQQWNSPIFLHNTIEYISIHIQFVTLWIAYTQKSSGWFVHIPSHHGNFAIFQSTFRITAPSIFIDIF